MRNDSGHPNYGWEELLGFYCGRELSASSGKLVTISAIAKECSLLKRTPYVAGLWAKSLVTNLF
jgi:hypothetical protein